MHFLLHTCEDVLRYRRVENVGLWSSTLRYFLCFGEDSVTGLREYYSCLPEDRLVRILGCVNNPLFRWFEQVGWTSKDA